MKLEVQEINYYLTDKVECKIIGHFKRYNNGPIQFLEMCDYLDIYNGEVIDTNTGEIILRLDYDSPEDIIPYVSADYDVDIKIENKVYTDLEQIKYVIKRCEW